MIVSPSREADRAHYIVLLEIAEIMARMHHPDLDTWLKEVELWKQRIDTHDYTREDAHYTNAEAILDKARSLYPNTGKGDNPLTSLTS